MHISLAKINRNSFISKFWAEKFFDAQACSHVETEVHDVSVLDDVVLALDAHLAGLADGGLGAVVDVVVVLDDLGADETLLEVGVDDTGTLRGLPAFLVGPGQ